MIQSMDRRLRRRWRSVDGADLIEDSFQTNCCAYVSSLGLNSSQIWFILLPAEWHRCVNTQRWKVNGDDTNWRKYSLISKYPVTVPFCTEMLSDSDYQVKKKNQWNRSCDSYESLKGDIHFLYLPRLCQYSTFIMVLTSLHNPSFGRKWRW